MPLPNIISGKTQRCTAKCKARGAQCMNPAAFGTAVCRYHGGHKRVRRGEQHWNFRGAGQTAPERQQRHDMSVFFHETESLMIALDLVAPGSTRTKGRKPRSEGHVDVIE
jgi:hypothetical protein